MKTKLSAWKCISISLRDRQNCRFTPSPHYASCRQDSRRTLKIETLSPRQMLAADMNQQPETHSTENGSVPGEVSTLIGDVNGDGDLTSLDALAVLNSINDPSTFPATLAMDLTKNESVDFDDYRLVLAAVQSHNFAANGYQSQSGSFPESMGGTTLVTSTCDADAVMLSTLQSTLANLQDQRANTTAPSQITALNQLIAEMNASIAQVQSRMDDCDVYGGGGSDEDGGTTAGDQGDPYGGDPNTGNGSSMGTTMGTTYDPYGGGSDPYGGDNDPYSGTGGTIAATGGTNASGSASGSGSGSTAGTTTGWTTGTNGSSYSGTTGSSGETASGTMAGSGFGTSAGGTSGTTSGTTTPDTTRGTTTYGSTTGSTSGSSGGSASGSTEPTAFKIAGLRAGMFNGMLDGIESPRAVREGKQLRVAGWVSGPWSERPAPSLTVFADINFDGDFADDGETVRFKSGEFYARSRDYGPFDQYSGFDAYFSLLDDGESNLQNGVPGNNTPSDEIDIHIEFTGDEPEITQSVHNVNPLFTTRPSVNVETSADGSKLLTVTSALWDPGLWDRHHVTVTWADGITSNATDESTTVNPLTQKYQPTEQKNIRVTRPMPEAGLPLYPTTVTLHDDDQGKTSYLIRSADVSRNNDDDNENAIEDMFDGGFAADDDVVMLSLSSITGAYAAAANPPSEELPEGGEPPTGGDPAIQEPPEPEGYFYLGYDTNQIKLWDSREKLFQYTPGEQKGANHPYNGQSDVWIEGIGIGATRITLSWQPDYEDDQTPDWEPERNILLGHIDVTVWGIDVDIDSDNNNDFNYPDNSDWEERLEGDKYGLGKLVYPDDPLFVPLRLRLPPGLDPEMPAIAVSLEFDGVGSSGVIHLWNAPKTAARTNSDIRDGGNRIYANNSYTLADLNYDAGTGGITIFLQGMDAFDRHAKKKGIDDAGKPDDRIRAILSLPTMTPLTDEVKYMVVDVGTFYPNLQNREELRSAMASEGVYGQADLPQFALRLISEPELRQLGMSWSITQFMGEPASVPGFKSAVYQDYVSRAYVLAFAGTDDYDDVLVDLWQGIGGYTEQYQAAMEIGFEFARATSLAVADRIVTGHSLGGGLASAAAVTGDIRADTFNSAGLMESTLFVRDANGVRVHGVEQYPGSIARYRNAGGLIDAYYLDWDILSFAQDYSPFFIPSALGKRYKMDGPVDAQMAGVGAGFLASKLIPGAGWVNIASELGKSGYYMGLCHKTLYYQYGLMVDETTGWDIYGYDL